MHTFQLAEESQIGSTRRSPYSFPDLGVVQLSIKYGSHTAGPFYMDTEAGKMETYLKMTESVQYFPYNFSEWNERNRRIYCINLNPDRRAISDSWAPLVEGALIVNVK